MNKKFLTASLAVLALGPMVVEAPAANAIEVGRYQVNSLHDSPLTIPTVFSPSQ